MQCVPILIHRGRQDSPMALNLCSGLLQYPYAIPFRSFQEALTHFSSSALTHLSILIRNSLPHRPPGNPPDGPPCGGGNPAPIGGLPAIPGPPIGGGGNPWKLGGIPPGGGNGIGGPPFCGEPDGGKGGKGGIPRPPGGGMKPGGGPPWKPWKLGGMGGIPPVRSLR